MHSEGWHSLDLNLPCVRGLESRRNRLVLLGFSPGSAVLRVETAVGSRIPSG